MELLETIRRYTEEIFSGDSRILAVYLLGSALRGNLGPESDIDLALMLEEGAKMSPLERLKIANNLAYKLERSVDLGEISSANLVYSREAFLSGVPVFQRNPEKAALRRAGLMGMYIQFNLDRKEVLDAYRAR
ncbi:MAG: DNA polymerase beta domain-containing protein region [Syntrophaceae bacterium]|nr:MAG: DNA polymerase beta domain-containing protein region [Syntrophaceae bacterium]